MRVRKIIISLVIFLVVLSFIPSKVMAQDDLPPEDSSGSNEVIIGWSYLARIQKDNKTYHVGYDDYKSKQRVVLLIYDDNLSLIQRASVSYNETYSFSGIAFRYTGTELEVSNATIVDMIPYKRRVCSYIDETDRVYIYLSINTKIFMQIEIVEDFPQYHKVQIRILSNDSSNVMLVNYETWYKVLSWTWIKLSKDNDSRFLVTIHSYYKLELIYLAPTTTIELQTDKTTAYRNEPINVTIKITLKYENGTEEYPTDIVILSVKNKTSGLEIAKYKVFIEGGVGSVIILIEDRGEYTLSVAYRGVVKAKDIIILEKTYGETINETTNNGMNYYVLGGIIFSIVVAVVFWYRNKEAIYVGA